MIIIKIIGIFVLWNIAGFILNFALYSHLPIEERKETETGTMLHYLLNGATVIYVLYLLFN